MVPNNNKNDCVKEKLKPWLIGLVVLVVIIVGWIVFGGDLKRKNNARREKNFLGKANFPADNPNNATANNPQYSYSHIVKLVKPAVVGISSSKAQPFLQKWGTGIVNKPEIAWRSCPQCGPVMINNFPEGPLAPIFCPHCRKKIGQNPAIQNQKWFQPTQAPAQNQDIIIAEYLLCQNCKVRIKQCPGIPWSNAKCPNCGSVMTHVIDKTKGRANSQTSPSPWSQPQAWGNNGGQGFGSNLLTMPCPSCGTNITRQRGISWASINCSKCGSSMFCPRVPTVQAQAWGNNNGQGLGSNLLTMPCPGCGTKVTRQRGVSWNSINCPKCGSSMFCPRTSPGQNQVWMRPTAQQTPQNPLQNGQGVVMPGFRGLGSGVIISKRGYILTNSHLVSGQNTVNVTLFTPQGQKRFSGQVVAHAADRDLAIVKINPQNINLPVAPTGNSDTIRAGDTVFAFGNPFGLSQTVTSGIISAVRGSMVIEGHKLINLIQTDAPINQGNSGGPLVNLRGEIIGINTAIYSPAQTHTGLGFTVPINQAKEVFMNYMDSAAQKMAMRFLAYPNAQPYQAAVKQTQPNNPAVPPEDSPAWLGINIQILNDVLAEQLRIPVDSGILINEVYANSPAAAAGLKRGDVIIRCDGIRIKNETQIRTLLADKKPGKIIHLRVLRGRKRLNIRFKTAGGAWQRAQQVALQKRQKAADLLKGAEVEGGSAELASVGVNAVTITPAIAYTYGLPENIKGVAVGEIEGLALKYGIKEGDIIARVNNRNIPDLVSFLKAIKRGDLTEGISFLLIRKGCPLEIVVKEKPSLLPKGL
jgi:serine protease Do